MRGAPGRGPDGTRLWSVAGRDAGGARRGFRPGVGHLFAEVARQPNPDHHRGVRPHPAMHGGFGRSGRRRAGPLAAGRTAFAPVRPSRTWSAAGTVASWPMLTVIGEALVDLVDSGDHRTFTAHLSGSPLNVAVGLARLGEPTEFMARFSGDTFGRQLREFAERNGVRLTNAVDAPDPSTLAFVNLDGQGKAKYDFYVAGGADWQWSADELAVPPDTHILHTGSLATWIAPGDLQVVQAMHRCRANMLVSYDPNVRPPLLGDPARAQPLIERAVAAAHIVKASEDDVSWLYPGGHLDDIARRWLRLGPAVVVITRGEQGAVAYTARDTPIVRPVRPIQLVDTIGAGDAFTSGLLSALARSGVRDAATLAAADLGTAVDAANLVAALTCERAGADPPTAAEAGANR